MNHFKAYLQSKNLSNASITAYCLAVLAFKDFIQKQDIHIDKKDILAYLEHLQKRGLANRSRAAALGSIKHYCSYLYQTGALTHNPAVFIKIRGVKKRILYKILSLEEKQEFLDNYQVLYPNEIKQALLLSFVIYQGIRKREWETLKISDINHTKATVFIPEGRTAAARTLPLEALQVGLLYRYLHQYNPVEKLFDPPPQQCKWHKNLREVYPKFHSLKQIRASVITRWIQAVGLRKAQYMAGHRYISSTENYLQNDLQSLKDDINTFHPLS